MAFKRLTACFLSGTGNSYRAARWLVEEAQERGIEAETVAIDRAEQLAVDTPGPEQLCAFYFPTHGFMPPWSMIKFLLRLQRGRGSAAAVVATRGAIKIGPVLIPGAAGEVAAILLVYVEILALYSLLWGLARIPPVRWLLSVCNPTRYYRNYHEPDTSRRDLMGAG